MFKNRSLQLLLKMQKKYQAAKHYNADSITQSYAFLSTSFPQATHLMRQFSQEHTTDFTCPCTRCQERKSKYSKAPIQVLKTIVLHWNLFQFPLKPLHMPSPPHNQIIMKQVSHNSSTNISMLHPVISQAHHRKFAQVTFSVACISSTHQVLTKIGREF